MPPVNGREFEILSNSAWMNGVNVGGFSGGRDGCGVVVVSTPCPVSSALIRAVAFAVVVGVRGRSMSGYEKVMLVRRGCVLESIGKLCVCLYVGCMCNGIEFEKVQLKKVKRRMQGR